MPIVVPPTGYPASPGPFSVSLIPEQERPAVFHILDLLASLGRYERRFALALLLFEHCLAENSDLARQVEGGALGLGTLDAQTNTLSGWQTMAARDGALARYHFGQALHAIASSLKDCPTLRTYTNHGKLRLARKQFEAHFPSVTSIRHVIGHIADFAATIGDKEKHSIRGPYKETFGRVGIQVHDTAKITFSDNLYDHTYAVTYDGAVHTCEISSKTLRTLVAVRETTYSGFDAALAQQTGQRNR